MHRDLTVIAEEPQRMKRQVMALLCNGECKLAFGRGKMSCYFGIS